MMTAQCLMVNCRNKAPDGEAMCSVHRDKRLDEWQAGFEAGAKAMQEAADHSACNRNVYRLQMGGVRLCDALRRIEETCATCAPVARKALNHNEPEPRNEHRRQAMTTVTQADREAAAKVRPNSHNSALILGGERDGTDIVLAAAYGREAAEARAFEAGAKAMQEKAAKIVHSAGHEGLAVEITALDPAQIAGDGK